MMRRLIAVVWTIGVLCASDVYATNTVFTLTSAPGDYIGQGRRLMIRPNPFTFTGIRQSFDNSLHFSITDFVSPSPPYSFWYAEFSAPSGARVTPGIYLNATRYPFQAAGAPGLSIHGDGRGCNESFGSFTVFEATYDNAGELLTFAADFQQRCESQMAPLLTGSVRYNSTVPITRRTDLLLDFGPTFGLYSYTNGIWSHLHPFSPGPMSTGDLDGNGVADAVFDFPGYGLWVRYNGATWRQLHGLDVRDVAVGDIDASGRDDLIVTFPGYGVYIWRNDTSWTGLHSAMPTKMVTADLDGSGRDDLILDFPGAGVWIWSNDLTWSPLHNLNASSLSAGDIDGNGRADLILDFPGYGLWIWFSNTSWIPLHSLSAARVTVGDVDGNLKDDVVIELGPYGIYAWMNNATWSSLPAFGGSTTSLVTADLDGFGQAAVIASGSGGTRVWRSGGGWSLINPNTTEAIAVGDLDGQ